MTECAVPATPPPADRLTFSVIGGLFGMNLIDNPWPFTLPQVAFAILLGMVLCLYFFFVKGWLR